MIKMANPLSIFAGKENATFGLRSAEFCASLMKPPALNTTTTAYSRSESRMLLELETDSSTPNYQNIQRRFKALETQISNFTVSK